MSRETEQSWWTHFFDDTYANFGLVPATSHDEQRHEEASNGRGLWLRASS